MSARGGGVESSVRRVRRHLLGRGIAAAVLWGAAAGGVVLLVAWLLAGADGWRQGSPVPLLLDGFVLALAAGAVVFLLRARSRWLGDASVASSMDGAAGLPAGSVLGSLELTRSVPEGASPSLARAGEGAVARRLDAAGAGSANALSGALGARVGAWVTRGGRSLGLVLPLVLLAGLLAPERAGVAWSGLAAPFHLLAAPAYPALAVFPGSVDVERGASLEVEVEAAGRTEVTVHWRVAGDVPSSAVVGVEEGGARFTLERVTAPLQYWVSAPDGARTPRFAVTPIDPLFLADLAVELVFPPHTDRFPEEYRGEPPPLTVPAGTRLRIEGRASRALGQAALVAAEGGAGGMVLEVDDTHFRGEWVPSRSGTYQWRFADVAGEAPEGGPAALELTIVPDAPPEIHFAYPARDTILPTSLRQPLVIEARDEYGVDAVELVAYRVTSWGESMEPVTERMDVGGARGVVVRPALNVSAWGLLPGDEVHYLARAVDNAPRPQRGETEVFVLRMPRARELRESARDRLDDVSERLEALSERASAAEEETRNLERQASARPDPGRGSAGQRRPDPRASRVEFEDREDVRRSLEEQRAMADEVDSLRAELEDLGDFMREAGASDAQLRRDLQELRELLTEISPPELRDRLRELAESLDRMDARRTDEALRELSEEQERFRERLETSLERFRRAAMDQELRAAGAESEEIAREERALAEAFRAGDDPERRAAQQEELEERARAVEERLERTGERAAATGQQEVQEAARSAAERAEAARNAMTEASERASAGESAAAGERADEAAAGMEEVSRQLEQMREAMEERRRRETAEALEGAADDALALARRQAELGERMRTARGDALADLRGDEAALQQGLGSLAENLRGAPGLSPALARELSGAVGRALAAVDGTVDALENRRIPSRSPSAASEDAVQALNDLALAAMQAMEQAGEGEAGSEADQLMRELSQLAEQQGELVDQSGALMPMELGAEALAEQMQQLAQGQESVAGGLDRLAGTPQSREEALGDLQAMAEEARELAREMEGGRLEPELLRRQERLFQRLLDAGRSLEGEEISEEREARAAGAFEVEAVEGLTPEALRALRFTLPDAVELQRLSPAQRQLVLEYFERLNRAPPEPSGGARPGGRE